MAPGTIEGCASYENYNDIVTDASLNLCSFIAFLYRVDVSDLLAWNPSLSKNETECALQPGYSYCARKTDMSAYVEDESESQCVEVELLGARIPGGTAPNCVCFTRVSGYDGFAGLDCESVAEDAMIPLSQLTAWNPWLGPNCDAAMFADLEENDWRAVCVGVNSTAPTATAASPPWISSGTKDSASISQVLFKELILQDGALTRFQVIPQWASTLIAGKSIRYSPEIVVPLSKVCSQSPLRTSTNGTPAVSTHWSKRPLRFESVIH